MLSQDLDLNNEIFSKDAKKASTREGYGKGIIQAAQKNSNVVVLCGDLTESTKLDEYEKEFPERFIETGIAEQNMAGIAAGLALSGKIPFISSFATFSPGRNWEQIRVAVCLSKTNVKIAGTHAGLSASQDGPTAQALEDLAITRVLPYMTVINPIDYQQAVKAVTEAALHQGPVYLRFMRNSTPVITTQFTPFTIGQSLTLTKGKDLSIFTTGTITANVLYSARQIEEKTGLSVEVVAFPTVKPLDEKSIITSAKKTRKVITVEEHQIYGGFGSAVAEVLAQKLPTRMKIIGVPDTFYGSGEYEELLDQAGLSVTKLTKSIREFVDSEYPGEVS